MDNEGSGLVGTLKMTGLLLLIFAFLGLAFAFIWSLIKIPFWIKSNNKTASTKENIIVLSFKDAMISPYSLAIILSSGIGMCFLLVFITNWNKDHSYLWKYEDTFFIVLTLTVVPLLVTVWYMLKEIDMILNFKEWYEENM